MDKKKIIITFDDFGLCEGINRGVVNLLNNNKLRSVSLIPTGYAFQSAVNIVKNNYNIDVGVHLSLIETKPILSKDKIPSIVSKNGNFENKFYIFLIHYLSGRIKEEHIMRELRAQIDTIIKAGIVITHLDSHQHVHMLPGIFKIVLKLAKEYKIPFVRIPIIPIDRRYAWAKVPLHRKLIQIILNLLGICYRFILRKEEIGFCDYSFGFLESGHLKEETIKNIIMSLKKGCAELVCHPAEESEDLLLLIGHWNYNWLQELEYFTSDNIKKYISDNAVELVGFSDCV